MSEKFRYTKVLRVAKCEVYFFYGFIIIFA